jgi:hypothetical protein
MRGLIGKTHTWKILECDVWCHVTCRCFLHARSSSEVVLQTMKHTMIYPGSDPSSKAIALRPVV